MQIRSVFKQYILGLLGSPLKALSLALDAVRTQLTALQATTDAKVDSAELSHLPNGTDVPATTTILLSTHTPDLRLGAMQRYTVARGDVVFQVPILPSGRASGRIDLYVSTTNPSCAVSYNGSISGTGFTVNSGQLWLISIHTLAAGQIYAERRQLQ
jgi:hypothetical protein